MRDECERWAYLLAQDLAKKRRELESTLRYRRHDKDAAQPVSGRANEPDKDAA